MQEQLLIYLHANDLSHPSWAVINALHKLRQYAERDNPEGLAQIAENKLIIVIVPAEDVLLTQVKLPKIRHHKLMQAVPYAIEEQLTDDIETLHFAIAKQQEDGNLPVAIASHEKMRSWLTLLRTWQIQADIVIPATFTLPWADNTWHILLDDLSLVRMDKYHGFACDKNNLDKLLNLALTAKEKKPQIIYLDKANNQQYLVNLPSPEINLLQNSYAVKKAYFPQLGKLWKTTAYLAICWLILLFLTPTVSYFILQQREQHIDRQIADIYRQHFPEAQNLIAPKLRLQEKLQKLMSQTGKNRLLVLLAYVGKGMGSVETMKLQRFDFQNNQLTLTLTATPEDFAKFTDFLSQQGLNVKQQNANLVGTRINVNLIIE